MMHQFQQTAGSKEIKKTGAKARGWRVVEKGSAPQGALKARTNSMTHIRKLFKKAKNNGMDNGMLGK